MVENLNVGFADICSVLTVGSELNTPCTSSPFYIRTETSLLKPSMWKERGYMCNFKIRKYLENIVKTPVQVQIQILHNGLALLTGHYSRAEGSEKELCM